MEKLKIPLEDEEFEGLVRLADADLRPMVDELRYLLRRELADRGLLPGRDLPEVTQCRTS